MESNQNESARSISELWINHLFKSLERLQQYEVNARAGCQNITEYLQIDEAIIPSLRLKNFSFMLDEFDITLSNCMAILKPEDIKKFKDKLNFIKNISSGKRKDKIGNSICLYKYLKNSVTNKNTLVLNAYFDVCSKQLYQLREELVISLGHILFLHKRESEQREM